MQIKVIHPGKYWYAFSLSILLVFGISGCAPAIESQSNIIVVDATPAAFPIALRLVEAFRQSYPDQPDILVNSVPFDVGWTALDSGSVQGFIQVDTPEESVITNSLGWAPIIFLASSATLASGDLTRDQVKSIFLGLPKSGGLTEFDAIYVYGMETDIQRQFNWQVLGGLQPVSTAIVIPEASALQQLIGSDSAGIGFSTCSGNQRSAPFFRIEGVSPDQASIQSGDYPYRLPLFISSKKQSSDALMHFIGWAQSADGQSVLSRFCDAGGK
jgi:hypothetical protein